MSPWIYGAGNFILAVAFVLSFRRALLRTLADRARRRRP